MANIVMDRRILVWKVLKVKWHSVVKERDIGRNRFLNPLGIKSRARCSVAVEKFQCIFTSGSLWNAKSRDEDQDSD